MQHKSWPDLCESLLDRLEAKGENTTTERAEFGGGGGMLYEGLRGRPAA